MDKKYFISVILPVHNEEGNIEKVIEDSNNFLLALNMVKEYEIIVVDDGSKDNTAEILSKLLNRVSNLKTVTHPKSLGYGRTLMSGLRNSQYPLIFFMDADGQFKIDSIKEMLNYILNYDIIIGYRYRRKDPFYRIVLGKSYTFLVFFLFGLNFKDINCGFKLFRRKTIEDKCNFNGSLLYAETLLRAKNKGFKIKEVPVRHFPRLKGKQSGASLKVIFNAIIDLVKMEYSLLTGRTKKSS